MTRFKIDKEGHRIILNTLITIVALWVLLFLAGAMLHGWFFWALLAFSLFVLFMVIRFFRVPEREMTFGDGLIIAPADGTVVALEKVFVEEHLGEERLQLSIFMSIWDVHANWYPTSGRVEYKKHHHGSFIVANHPKSSAENERVTTVLDDDDRIMIRQIAGYVARRVVSYAEVGDKVAQNERCGFIKFGSRVDTFLPLDYEITVSLGDKVKATKTVIARKSI